jgi:serine/threonine protein kinase/Tfp pilus assembly protein PilF
VSDVLAIDEHLIRRLPLPLAQLYRRAHNAKTPQERHHAAYYLWEAALKLLGSTAVVAYAELGDHDAELIERLENLARPSLGHWWEFVRRLVPVLADHSDAGFAGVRDLLLGRSRDDLPHAAGLDALLVQVLEGWDAVGARNTVRPTELFDRLVRYRNREIGHGAVGQRPAAFYERVGRALLVGVPEVLGRLDPLAGQRLVYAADVRRHTSGRWLVERYELRGEAPRRLESLDLPDGDAVRRLLPGRVYLEPAVDGLLDGAEKLEGETQVPGAIALHPLLVYEADDGDVLFLNARRGRQRVQYLSYNTGREVERDDLACEQRALLARVLHVPVDAPSVAAWTARSQTEEQADGGPEESPAAPRRLGEFELLSELGRGGMGVVYRAWQPSLGRQVAVKKLYHTGDPKAAARFAREIRALGHVEHPHLVKIFTSGAEGEQWFYAMELVEGATLAAVCEKLQSRSSRPETVDLGTWQQAVSTVCAEARQAEKPLSKTPAGRESPPGPNAEPGTDASRPPVRFGQGYVRQAVDLVLHVAEAAHALHERGILHRDIKPGNVMVTANSDQAVLMDLGLAQIADDVEGRLTKTRQFVGTLRYASPEQVLAVGGLDRRSDVYNLGATLWELLTFQPMFGATAQTPTPELMRRIQVQEPERPRKYHPRLSRDLEAVVLKCLEKDPKRRYATARELVRDLQRYQAGEPVHARPVSGLQRGWRWCRRNPAVAGMLAALAVVLVGSLAGLTALYVNAERQRRLAEHREEAAQAVSRFYKEHVLAAARPKGWDGGTGKDVTLKEALDEAVQHIDEDFANQPELEATVRDTLGMTYYYLGQFAAANPQLERAYAIRRQVLGPDHLDTLTSLLNLARERWKQGRVKEAITMGREAVERRRRVLGPEHEDTLWAQLNLGLFLEEDGQFDEAESVLRPAIESCKATLGPDHHHTLHGQNDLAIVLWFQGKRDESVALDRQTLEGRRRSLGPEHPDTLRSMDNLANSLQALGRLDEAEQLCRQALEARRRVLGEAHDETFWSLTNLALILEGQGKLAEAEDLDRQTLETAQRLRGREDAETLYIECDLGSLLQRRGKYAEAETVLRRNLEARRRVLGPEASGTVGTLRCLACLRQEQGDLTEAERLFREALEANRRQRGPENTFTLATQGQLADLLRQRGKLTDAEALWRQTLDTQRRVFGPDASETVGSLRRLAGLRQEQGDLAEAESLLREAFDANRRRWGPESSPTLGTQCELADVLGEQGKPGESEKLFSEVLAVRRKTLAPNHLDLADTLDGFGTMLARNGRAAEAEPLLRECLRIREEQLDPSHWRIAVARSLVGGCLTRQGKFADAEPLVLGGGEALIRTTGAPAKRVTEALDRIIELYEKWGKPDQAELWRKKRPAQGR